MTEIPHDRLPTITETWPDGSLKQKWWVTPDGGISEKFPENDPGPPNGEISYMRTRSSGQLTVREWRRAKEPHRDGAPARRLWDEDGFLHSEEWFQDGVRHRDAGPATIVYSEDEQVLIEQWYRDGRPFRKDGLPTKVTYFSTGEVDYEEWKPGGVAHREDDLPARIHYLLPGQPVIQTWCFEGKIHRENAPAEIEIHDDGKTIYRETWRKHGIIHREGEPAHSVFYEDGSLESAEWHENGVCLRKVSYWPGGRLRSEWNLGGDKSL